MALKTYREDELNVNTKESIKRWTLNFTDIVENSNKYYNLEVIQSTDNKYYLYTNYGRVGGTAAREYRICDDQTHAEKEAEKIIKSKTKKGYVEVKLTKADVGSDVGKAKIETSVSADSLKKAGIKIQEEKNDSKLHPQVQDLIRTWFGATQEFIDLNLDTKKCPLGQLSIDQIVKGRDILDEARKIVHAKKDIDELNKLTNSYYSNIPHNFGYSRINADTLRLDNDSKIDKAFDILDVFADAKSVQNVIAKKSNIDAQYETLQTDIGWIEPTDPVYVWIEKLFHETRAHNHSALGKLKVHKIFKVARNKEQDCFLKNTEIIAKECGKQNLSSVYHKLVKERPDVPKHLSEIYYKANVAPGWHGTRRANMIGITTKGLLIRLSGIIHAGSMYGDSIYLASNSTKSINYVDVRGSYWAQGNNKKGYLYLIDAAYGNQLIASGSHMYTSKNIRPNHSVWAKGGKSGVINDEFMLYHQTGPNQQHAIRYIVEFETQA